MKKCGILSISTELLEDALHINCRILDIRVNNFTDRIEILLTGESMPEYRESEIPAIVSLQACLKPNWQI